MARWQGSEFLRNRTWWDLIRGRVRNVFAVEQCAGEDSAAAAVPDAIAAKLESWPLNIVVRPTSVADLVGKVKAALPGGTRLGRLDIIGHGTPGCLSVGSGSYPVTGKYINHHTWEALLLLKAANFWPNPARKLRLIGCNTALCEQLTEESGSGTGLGGPLTLKSAADGLNHTSVGMICLVGTDDFTHLGLNSTPPRLTVQPDQSLADCPIHDQCSTDSEGTLGAAAWAAGDIVAVHAVVPQSGPLMVDSLEFDLPPDEVAAFAAAYDWHPIALRPDILALSDAKFEIRLADGRVFQSRAIAGFRYLLAEAAGERYAFPARRAPAGDDGIALPRLGAAAVLTNHMGRVPR